MSLSDAMRKVLNADMRETLSADQAAILKSLGFSVDEPVPMEYVIALSIVNKASKGDISAAFAARDLAEPHAKGQRPVTDDSAKGKTGADRLKAMIGGG